MIALPDWIVPHMPVVFGLLAGTIAKFGMAFDTGQLTRGKVVSQVSMLATLGIIAECPADFLGLAPTPRAIAGVAAALLGAKLIAKFERFSDLQADKRFGDGGPGA